MLWLLVALQAITPFIHAHAGAVQLKHASFMHLHPGAHGRPLRIGPLGAASDVQPAVTLLLPRAERTTQSSAGLPAPPQPQRVPAEHTHPHALAPPSV